MKLYLAHPLSERKWVREWEMGFEAKTGIELVNPFYDTDRPDVAALDRGETVPGIEDREEAFAAVRKDLSLIDSSDGVVAILTSYKLGSPMEVFYAWHNRQMPVYTLVTSSDLHHPWLSKCENFTTLPELEKRLVEASASLHGRFHTPIRIGFVGFMGAGKSSAASYLEANYSFKRYSFATKLKELAVDLFNMDPNKKDRVLLQKLGTDAMRSVFPDVWINYLLRRLRREKPLRACVDDCRFLNEAEALRKEGFVIVRVLKEGSRTAVGIDLPEAQAHLSELEMESIVTDYTIKATSLKELHGSLDSLVEKLMKSVPDAFQGAGGSDEKAYKPSARKADEMQEEGRRKVSEEE